MNKTKKRCISFLLTFILLNNYMLFPAAAEIVKEVNLNRIIKQDTINDVNFNEELYGEMNFADLSEKDKIERALRYAKKEGALAESHKSVRNVGLLKLDVTTNSAIKLENNVTTTSSILLPNNLREPIVQEMLAKGFSQEKIKNAIFLRKALGVPIECFLEEYKDYVHKKEIENSQRKILKNLSNKYLMDENSFLYVMNILEMTIEEIYKQIQIHENDSEAKTPMYMYDGEALIIVDKNDYSDNYSYDISKTILKSTTRSSIYSDGIYSFANSMDNCITVNKYFNPAFTVNVNDNEKVNPANGTLIYEKELFTVPGRDNQDFTLKLRYNSSRNNMYGHAYDNYYKNSVRGFSNQDYLSHALGAGWSFNLSYIESNPWTNVNFTNNFELFAYKVAKPEWLHLSDGRVLELKRISDREYEFKDKTIKDMKFEVCDTMKEKQEYYNDQDPKDFPVNKYIKGEWSPTPTFKLVHKNGITEYFNYDGKLLGVLDRNKNGFNVQYENLKNGATEMIYPCKIQNSLGDEITIKVGPGGWAESEITWANKEIKVKKVPINDSIVVDSISIIDKNDSSNNETTHFQYLCDTRSFNVGGSDEDNYYAVMKKIIYPTGKVSEYDFDCIEINIGRGFIPTYKIFEQTLKDNDKVYSTKRYEYYGLRTDVIDANRGRKSEYYYNNDEDMLLTEDKVYIDNNILSEGSYQYNQDKLITGSTTVKYNLGSRQNKEYSESYEYDSKGNLSKYVNIDNTIATYKYEDKYSLVTSEVISRKSDSGSDVILSKIEYTRDAKGNITKEIVFNDEGNIETNYKLNRYGEVQEAEIVKSDGQIVKQRKSSTNGDGKIATGVYIMGRRKEEIIYHKAVVDHENKARDYSEVIGYNDNTGDIIKYRDKNRNISQYEYDYKSRLTKIINPDNTVKQLSYNDKVVIVEGLEEKAITYGQENGSITMTDELGYKERIQYDALGNTLKKEAFINNAWETKEENIYDQYKRLKATKDANGNTTTYDYDKQDRIIKITNPDSTTIKYAYDDVNLTKTVTNEENHSVTEFYDIKGNVIKRQVSNGRETLETRYEYDHLGNLIKSTDPKGNETKYEYDKISRLKKVIDAKNQETVYDYDETSNHMETKILEYDSLDLTNQNRKLIKEYKKQNKYDQLGRIIKGIDEELKETLFKYDGNGNLLWIKDKKNQEQNFEYNKLNQLVKHTLSQNKTEYTYRADGKLTEVKEFKDKALPNYNKTGYIYYGDGKLQTEVFPDNKSITYTYDNNGNPLSVTDVLGQTASYTYDSRNRIKNVISGNKTFIYDYYQDGMVKSITYPSANGQAIKAEYTYDVFNRLTKVQNKIGNKIISSYDYTHDLNGNIQTIGETGKNINYSYDKLNRLTAIDRVQENQNIAYDYDIRSNLKSETSTKPLPIQLIPSNYQWNELNQLTKFTNNHNQEYEYKYNYEGLRTHKKTPEKEINYYYNRGKQTVSEIHSDGTNVSIIWSNKPLARIVNGKYYYYMYNGHNDVVQMIDENGKIANEYSYDEWGNQLTEREEVENPIRYTGQYYDKESGNYYLRARYYSPAFKRFISEDTYKGSLDKPLSLNLYGYCSGNPVMLFDPSGNVPLFLIPVVTFGVTWATAILASPDINQDMNDLAMSIAEGDAFGIVADTAGILIPAVPGRAVKGVGEAGTKTVKYLCEKVDDVWDGSKSLAKGADEAGIGLYKNVKGHHIHAKAAFKGHVSYDMKKGLSISQDFMKGKGWSHSDMTTKQRQLFKELFESGRANTLEEHTRIAIEALQAGGATLDEATQLVNRSITNLIEQGVNSPTRIPWYTK